MQSIFSLLILFVALVAATPTAVKRTTVSTPLGSITGTATISGVERFVFKYADHARWQASTVVTTMTASSTLPPVCAQPKLDNSGWIGQEDCLYIALYVPTNCTGTGFVWFHGGSLLVSGANDPAIEASKLALATGSVVAVVQYRLGVLGWLPPASSSSTNNLGVRDAILALDVLDQIFDQINVTQVTIGGHSAGSMLVRALLAAPSASGYFHKAVMLSDPMAYGFYNSSTITTLQNNFFPSVGCTTTNSTCHNALSLGDIMDAQMSFNPVNYDASTAGQIPFRPSKDGSLITSSMTTSFPSSPKPLWISTARDEAGVFIYGSLPELPENYYSAVLSGVIPDFRATAIEAAPAYALDSNDPDTLRKTLKNVVTDLGWRCSSQYFAKQWAAAGGDVWTAETLRGVTYPANANVDYCADSETQVCHQNDIEVVFGTVSSPSTTIANLTTEIQARLKNFFGSSTNPNTSGYPTWNKTTSSTLNLLPLGSGLSVTPPGACANLWGTSAAPFDWQMFGL